MVDRYDQVGRYGVLCRHISQAAVRPQSLGNYMFEGQHLQEEHQRGLGEASYCRLCWAKTILIARYLQITASNTIKVAYHHTRIVYTGVGVLSVVG